MSLVGKGLQEYDNVFVLLSRQGDTHFSVLFQHGVECRIIDNARCLVRQHPFQGGETAIVHVRGSTGNIAQAWDAKFALFRLRQGNLVTSQVFRNHVGVNGQSVVAKTVIAEQLARVTPGAVLPEKCQTAQFLIRHVATASLRT